MFCLLHFKSLKRHQLGGSIDKKGEPFSADLGKIVNLMQCVFLRYSRFVTSNASY